MSLRVYYFLFILFTCIQVNSAPRKETLSNKVSSFIYEQQDSTIVNATFLQIKELYDKGNKDDNYPKAIEKGLEFLKKYSNNYPEKAIQVNIIIGKAYRANNNIDRSILHYKKAMSFFQNSSFENAQIENRDKTKFNLYLKLGNNYLTKRNSQRKKGNTESVARYKDSAKYYYDLILNANSLDQQVLSYQGSASSNLSGIYMQDSLYAEAKDYALRAIEIHQKRNNKISEAVALGNLASILLEQEDFTEAKKNYQRALEIIKNEKSNRAIRVREQLFYNLAYNLYRLKDYKAYDYQELSYNIKDSLRDKEIRSMIEQITEEYNFESKKELLLKEAENERLKTQRTFVIVGVVAIIIILLLLYWVKLNQLKLQRTKFEKNKELAKVEADVQAKLVNATIDGREQERKEIAETLHDSVSAMLSSANLHLQASSRQIIGEIPKEIEKTQQIIKEASDKIRDLSHTLVSSVLLKFGLNYAVNEMAEKYSNSEIQFFVDVQGIRRYNQQFEIKVHNIIQEFVNNILKHSKATEAYIFLEEKNQNLLIRIHDNGIGFDKSKVKLKEGIGLNQIQARIRMLNGKFMIESKPSAGTSITAEMPVVGIEVKSFGLPVQ